MKKTATVAAAAFVLVSAIRVVAATHYFQDFETDTSDWMGAIRVASGTNGVASAAGDFHAEVSDGAFTKFDGYETTFPNGGYTTSVDVYLNVDAGDANDTRFDWSSAIGTPANTHRRDFVFNAGFYNDSDATGSGPRFVISASPNATRSAAFPKNPGRDPFTITASGWYTLEHRFYNAGLGQLKVDLRITDLNGTPLHSWTLGDASDIIGTTVGGHRYGWFVIQESPLLAIDNASLLSVNLAGNTSACKNDGWQTLTRVDGSMFNSQGDCIQYVNTGK